MALLSSKLRNMGDGLLAFWCPGCVDVHAITTEGGGHPCWSYNGDPDAPTFQPSILVRGLKLNRNEAGEWTGEGVDSWARDAAGNTIPLVCHSFVTDGQIQFLNDCTHALTGQTVPIPDLPAHLRDED